MTLNNLKSSLFLYACTLLIGCKSNTELTVASITKDNQVNIPNPLPVKREFSQDTSVIFTKINEDNTLALQLKRIQKTGDPATIFEYQIRDIKTKKVVKEGTFRGTDVQWYDSVSIELVPYIGIEEYESDEDTDHSDNKSNLKSQIIKIK